MQIIDFCATRKKLIVLLMIIITIFGINSYKNITRESNPDIKIPIIYVMVNQRGVDPENIKKTIIQPIENILQTINGIKELTSYAYQGAAAVKIEFNAGIDTTFSLNEVRNKVEDIKYKLPKDADAPIIKQVDLII